MTFEPSTSFAQAHGEGLLPSERFKETTSCPCARKCEASQFPRSAVTAVRRTFVGGKQQSVYKSSSVFQKMNN